MPQILSSIKLDLQNRPTEPAIYAKVGDNLSRQIAIELYNGGVAWPVPSGTEIAIRYMRADGCKGYYSRLPDKRAACTVRENTVTCTLVDDVTAVAGIAMIDLAITDKDSTLCTFSCKIIVDRAPATDHDIPAGWYDLPTLRAINEAIAELQEAQGQNDALRTIIAKGAPTTSTKGAVGQLYLDTDSKIMYKCISVSRTTYTWVPVFDGGVVHEILTISESSELAFEHVLRFDAFLREELPALGLFGRQDNPCILTNLAAPRRPEDAANREYVDGAVEDKVNTSGYTPNKILGTDENGNVVEMDSPAPLVFNTPPTTSTQGNVGQLYLDTDSKIMYKCVSVSGTTYTWEPVFNGGEISEDLWFAANTFLRFNDFYIESGRTQKGTASALFRDEYTDLLVLLSNIANPESNQDAATKGYVDESIENNKFDGGTIHNPISLIGVPISFSNINGNPILAISGVSEGGEIVASFSSAVGSHLVRIAGISNPKNENDATNKIYVDEELKKKANASGYTPNKALGTDDVGNIKEIDLPTGGIDDNTVSADQTWSSQKINEEVSGKISKAEAGNIFAPAIKVGVSGEVISTDMISPVEHEVACRVKSKNLLPMVNSGNYNGVSWTVDADGKIHITGTTTAPAYIYLVDQKAPMTLDHGTYWLSGNENAELNFFARSGSKIFNNKTGSTKVMVSEPDDWYFYINIDSGKTVDAIVYPQFERGSVATPYTPYVPDLTKVRISQYGKNLLNTTVTDFSKWIPAESIGMDSSGFAYLLSLPASKVTISCNHNGEIAYFYVMESSDGGTTWQMIKEKGGYLLAVRRYEPITFTPDANKKYAFWANIDSSFNAARELQVEFGDTRTSYEEPKGMSFSPSADGVVSGMRSVSPSMILMTDTPGVVISARYNADTERYIANNYVPKSTVTALEGRIAALEKAVVTTI